jgi:hypothetical protein
MYYYKNHNLKMADIMGRNSQEKIWKVNVKEIVKKYKVDV